MKWEPNLPLVRGPADGTCEGRVLGTDALHPGCSEVLLSAEAGS